MYEQVSIFDWMLSEYRISRPIRLIELFAGIGSQAMALRDLGADFEHYRISEWQVHANRSYKAIHHPEDHADYSERFVKFKWLARALYECGISADGKARLSLKEIRSRGEKWCRQVYNEFKSNRNIGSIISAHALDLGIVDTENYCYVMTYSFPCQDLSVAGSQKGMAKGSGTRSGLLWEVERLLNECSEFPQVLLMENVPQVHSKANMLDFQRWMDFLSGKGYSNYWQNMNAKDYGVPQNRDRCFMVSILGEWNFKFPRPITLEKSIKDYLEDMVEKKYYIETEKSQKLIRLLMKNGVLDKAGQEIGSHKGRDSQICVDLSLNNPGERRVGNCITAEERGISNRGKSGNGVVERESLMGSDMIIDDTQGFEKEPRMYFGISPCLRSERNGLKTAVVAFDREWRDSVESAIMQVPRGYNKGGVHKICPSITSSGFQENNFVAYRYRIRRLVPLECWRLMGFSDEDFRRAEAVNSDSQLYRQAGNSIVKDVLMAIFRQMMPENRKDEKGKKHKNGPVAENNRRFGFGSRNAAWKSDSNA